jgi:large repetitive protein
MREPLDDPATCAGKETQKEFTLWIRRPVAIVVPAAPRSEVGVSLRMRLRARGGSGHFTWRRAAGQLPSGVKISSDGSITGVPRTAGTFHVEVRAEDTEARSASWAGTLRVARRLVIRTGQLPAASLGRPYTASLTTEGGVAPRMWKLAQGRLPRGIRFTPALGSFSGTPTEVGTYRVTVRVRDALNVQAADTLKIVVRSPRRPRSPATRQFGGR